MDGRYRVTSPAYNDPTQAGKTEQELINLIIPKLIMRYGLPANHSFHLVEDADQLARLIECCGTYFRYGRDPAASEFANTIGGAWEMDTDGRPKVNMAKAMAVQMGYIRRTRNAELVKYDGLYGRALEHRDGIEQDRIAYQKQTLRDLPVTFDLTGYQTPITLRDAWPSILPLR